MINSFFRVNSVQRLDQTSWKTSKSVREFSSLPQALSRLKRFSLRVVTEKRVEHVTLDLQSFEGKSAKAMVC